MLRSRRKVMRLHLILLAYSFLSFNLTCRITLIDLPELLFQ